MKKVFLILIITLCLSNNHGMAQYAKLVDFQGANGCDPWGSLIHAGKALYGMSYLGGTYSWGFIFKINEDGTGYTVLHEFYDIDNGCHPKGSLIISGDLLYGMTYRGGIDDLGCVFKIDTNGTGYTKLLDFDTLNGRRPMGSLTMSGNVLYGMTCNGGTNDLGCIFSINTEGTGYVKIHDFNDTINGRHPYGSLIISEGTLYGMTSQGGENDIGCIFRINNNGSSYDKLLDFDGEIKGECPYGSLTLSGDTLYGMTIVGGTDKEGCIFSIHKDGTGFARLHDFNGDLDNGAFPRGSLTLLEDYLYGMTSSGGAKGLGCIFQFDLSQEEYTTLWSFDSIDGYCPVADLTISNNTFYGMTREGGAHGDGVVFKYRPDIEINLQTSNINFPFIGITVANISWTNGNGEKRAVFLKEGMGTITNPDDGTTYTASIDWNSKGSQLGSSGYYCVYNDTGNFVSVNNLTPGTTYTVQAFEYNGETGTEQYLLDTGTGNPNTFQTESVNAIQDNREPSVRIFSDGSDIYTLINHIDSNAQLAVYNLSGFCLVQSNNLVEGQNKITGNYQPGIYVIKLVLDKELYTEKVRIYK